MSRSASDARWHSSAESVAARVAELVADDASVDEAFAVLERTGLPAIIRPSFTLGGAGFVLTNIGVKLSSFGEGATIDGGGRSGLFELFLL